MLTTASKSYWGGNGSWHARLAPLNGHLVINLVLEVYMPHVIMETTTVYIYIL